MAVRYMIDSDTLSYVMKGRDLQLRERFSKKLRQMSISSVVFAEIAYGLNKKASSRYQAVFDTLLEIVPVEPDRGTAPRSTPRFAATLNGRERRSASWT